MVFFTSVTVQDKLQPQVELSAKVMTVDTDSMGTSCFSFLII